MCRLLSLTVAAQLSSYGRPDPVSQGWLLLFSCVWIPLSALLLPAPCLELRDVDRDRNYAFTAGILTKKSRAKVFPGNIDQNCYFVTAFPFLLDVLQQKCCLLPSVRMVKGPDTTQWSLLLSKHHRQEPFMLYPAILAPRWTSWPLHSAGAPH